MSVGELVDREERPAYVRFERRAVEDKRASLEAGRSVSKDVDYALITPPYSKDLVEIKVETWLENTRRNVKNGRTPKKWFEQWQRAYQDFQNGQETPLDGTPIKEWSAISPAQIKNLLAINILTVEDLAGVNDEGIRRIGMGGLELKRKAENWLKAATDHGPLTMKVTQLETENAQLKATNEGLMEKNRLLMNQLEASRQPIHAVEDTISTEITMEDIAPEPEPVKLEPVQEESLTEQYIAKFGKKPHHKMKEETIRQKLLE